ncbi:MAG: Flp family type IVb pilin [Pseudomonadota bacterium]
MPANFARFLEDEDGATAIEYGLIVSLIFVAIVGAVRQYATNTENMYSEISSNLEN